MTNLKLRGYVGGWDFDPDYIDWFLANNPGEVSITIDSLGGSLISAMSVNASIREHGKAIVTYVGYNASAATIISLGAKSIKMDKHAFYMIHKCTSVIAKCKSLNADELHQYITELGNEKETLEKFDWCIAAMYAERCKKPLEDLHELMKKSVWLTAQEALEWGFVDEIVDVANKENTLSQNEVSLMVENHIPLPPGYDHRPTKVQNLLRSIFECFRKEPEAKQQINEPEIKDKDYPTFEILLGSTKVTFTDGLAQLSEEQLDKLQESIQNKEDKIKGLEQELQAKLSQITTLGNLSRNELNFQSAQNLYNSIK